MYSFDIVDLSSFASTSWVNQYCKNYISKSTADSTYATASHSHTEYAASSHNHSATNITSGTLPITRGGTGSTAVSGLSSGVLTAASGFTISSCRCRVWGPITYVYAVIKTTNAISAYVAKTVATVSSTYASSSSVGHGVTRDGGVVYMSNASVVVATRSAIAANGSIYLHFSFIK